MTREIIILTHAVAAQLLPLHQYITTYQTQLQHILMRCFCLVCDQNHLHNYVSALAIMSHMVYNCNVELNVYNYNYSLPGGMKEAGPCTGNKSTNKHIYMHPRFLT